MDEVDIFQRTLKCQEAALADTGSEIFDVDSFDEKVEEESEITEGPDSAVIDYEALYKNLECAKRRIQKLLIIIKAKTDPCYRKPCPQPELSCEDKKIMCELKKAFYRMQCKIYELTRCFQCIREEIRGLHSCICKQTKDIKQLNGVVALVQFWRESIKLDEGICYWRYVYIKDTKADWKEMQAMLLQEKRCHEHICEEYLTRRIYKASKIYLQAEFEILKGLFVELFELGNPNSSICSGDKISPLKKIEEDYIKSQIRKNKKDIDESCGYIFYCNNVDL